MFLSTNGGRAAVACFVISLILVSSSTSQAGQTKLDEEADNTSEGYRSLQSCDDNYGMTFVDTSGSKRDCSWLAGSLSTDATARKTYCNPGQGFRTPLAAVVCPKTCGTCPDKCADTSAYIGKNKNGRIKKCKWLRAKEKRLLKYCSKEAGFNKRADVACPQTCGKCGVGGGGGGGGGVPQTPSENACDQIKAAAGTQSCSIGPKIQCETADGVQCDSLVSSMQCSETPTEITFRIFGGQCFQSTNKQNGDMKCMSAFSGTDGLDDFTITLLGAGVEGVLNKANHLYYTKSHKMGDEITVKGTTALPDTPSGQLRNLVVVLQDKEGKVRQSMKLMTNCGQHKLAYRDRFGALEVKKFANKKQGTVPTGVLINYKYIIENTGRIAAAVQKFESKKNGVTENLLTNMAGMGGEPLVNVCDKVEVVRSETIDLSKRSSFIVNLAVNALDNAGLGCGGSASLSFVAGDP